MIRKGYRNVREKVRVVDLYGERADKLSGRRKMKPASQ